MYRNTTTRHFDRKWTKQNTVALLVFLGQLSPSLTPIFGAHEAQAQRAARPQPQAQADQDDGRDDADQDQSQDQDHEPSFEDELLPRSTGSGRTTGLAPIIRFNGGGSTRRAQPAALTWMFQNTPQIGQIQIKAQAGLSAADRAELSLLTARNLQRRARTNGLEDRLGRSDVIQHLLANVGLTRILKAHLLAKNVEARLSPAEAEQIARKFMERAAELQNVATPTQLSNDALYDLLRSCPRSEACLAGMRQHQMLWFFETSPAVQNLFSDADDRAQLLNFLNTGAGGMRPAPTLNFTPTFAEFSNNVRMELNGAHRIMVRRLALASLAREQGFIQQTMAQHLAWSVESGFETYQTIRALFEQNPVVLNPAALQVAHTFGQFEQTDLAPHALARAILPFMPGPTFDAAALDITQSSQVYAFDPSLLILVYSSL